jgi:hypothetical protein
VEERRACDGDADVDDDDGNGDDNDELSWDILLLLLLFSLKSLIEKLPPIFNPFSLEISKQHFFIASGLNATSGVTE